MKKLLFLSILFLGILTSYGQKKPMIINMAEVFSYPDIENIISNKQELGLTPKQEAIFTIKNEYIKRDMLTLNDRTDMLPIEKINTNKKIRADYNLFIERTLNDEQMDKWSQIKINIALAASNDENFKKEAKKLYENYKTDHKEIYRKYKTDKRIYRAQVTSLRKKFDTDYQSLEKYYNAPEKENSVMSLEEIANLVKEFDEVESTSPLKYLNVNEPVEEVYEENIND